ncbi:MAG: methionyl-tRNA formyltransferase [Clostridiales bacterium]|nr:methionyl-tRNA formyltransferase [Clostridiales bacterium]
MDIVFMGTPEFSVPCLKRLISDGHRVSGVFTQPDKPKGRGNIMTPPPVKVEALKNGIPVFQPMSMKDGTALDILKKLSPELIIVTAYGKILPKEILFYPKYGCINIHASLLPKYRGAAPIQWSVINGEKKTGVTSMQMNEGLDTGDMLLSDEIEIGENDNAGVVHDKLSELGAEVMSKTIDALLKGELRPVKQDDSLSNYAPMLTKELCPVDWSRPASEVHNMIRGLSPWPVAVTTVDGKPVKLHESRLCDITGGREGEVVECTGSLVISCGDKKCVEILKIQAQGKKAMSAADYLRGNRMEKGTICK